ncbi:UDP-N-acetylmuramate dehydrogenase [Methylotenera versatilis]|uniref:UDP-N-acetylmuramate dehydrogenase n=1 Tax=Methylotenera versatilis TaxID=1055487 RepID=UPI0006458301|nr:UDP-N-acetylmuramate dehydrogenase [Methylotenera versatilis]
MVQTEIKMQSQLLENEPLARYTSWRVGGRADRVFIAENLSELQAFLQSLDHTEPIVFMGLGSNLLVRDGGVRGTVIVMHQALSDLRMDGQYIYAEAGVTCGKLARFSANNAKDGAEFMAGIPGTVGGALAMNAGCYGSETWSIVHQVLTIDRTGITHVRNAAEFVASYRHIEMPVRDEWFLGAWFKLDVGDANQSLKKIKNLLATRLASQPLNLPSAGSTFRNPHGDFAARLIEASGLKGYQIGGAQVSPKHANFIVNVGECTALDIEMLIKHMKDVVLEKQGVALQQEVRVIGEYA